MSTENTTPTKHVTQFRSMKVKKSVETQMVQKQSSFSSRHMRNGNRTGVGIDPLILLTLVNSNNTLPLCVEAMEVNIDGTGHDIVALDQESEANANEEQIAKSFFKEPFPGTSMVSMRRELRRYLESTGNAYIELIPNLEGDLIMMRSLKPQYVKLGELSEVAQVKRKIERAGKIIEVTMNERERSYIYEEPDADPIYFIEFGATQRIHKEKGLFGAEQEIAPVERGNEIIHLKMNDDPTSDYGLPRWISQTPSAVGSRKAEEQNLEFFDAGGIPNVLVFVKGGAMADTTTAQLNGYLSGGMKSGGRAAVVEVASTSGTIDKAGQVEVQVERFGSETLGDEMYAKYDARCEERIRLSFRLPALFIGKTSDYNYATARVAYQVAEAQVFKPDRDEFDVLMNQIIVKKLGLATVRYKSRPITLNDIEAQLKALEMVKEVVEPQEFVEEVTGLSNVNVSYKEGKEFTAFKNLDGRSASVAQVPVAVEPAKTNAAQTKVDPKKDQQTAEVKKGITALEALQLANKFATASGLLTDDSDYDEEECAQIKSLFNNLPEADKTAVSKAVSLMVFGTDAIVPEGLFA